VCGVSTPRFRRESTTPACVGSAILHRRRHDRVFLSPQHPTCCSRSRITEGPGRRAGASAVRAAARSRPAESATARAKRAARTMRVSLARCPRRSRSKTSRSSSVDGVHVISLRLTMRLRSGASVPVECEALAERFYRRLRFALTLPLPQGEQHEILRMRESELGERRSVRADHHARGDVEGKTQFIVRTEQRVGRDRA
jgi:hypothetical protein